MKPPINSKFKNFNLLIRKTKGNEARIRNKTDLKSDGSINYKKLEEFRKQSYYQK